MSISLLSRTISVLCSLLFVVSSLQAQIISTVAGRLNTGDGGPATLATVNAPEGVVMDASGNVYFTESQGNVIRKINAAGIITTIAGTTAGPGFSGDGGPATSARVNYPTSLAIDASGNLYFADYYNNRIRKISTSGIITTFAGTGVYNYSGDGGQATAATFRDPYGVQVDASGNIYIAERYNHCIRKVGTNGIITTIAGTGIAGFSGDGGLAKSAQLRDPTGIAIDASGNIYIGDRGNWRIRKINTSGIITTIAGTGTQGLTGDGGQAISAQLSFFAAPTLDVSGNLYFADAYYNRVRKISTSGIITSVAGSNNNGGYGGDGGAATSALLLGPQGLFLQPNGAMLIGDRNNNRIRQVNTSGIISTIAGPNNGGFGGDGNLATSARLNNPVDVKGDGNGNFYIAETAIGRIRKVDVNGIITSVAGTTAAGYSGDGGPATAAKLAVPYAILPDGSGNLYIADTYNHRIRKVDTAGVITTIAGTGIGGFSGDNGPAINAQLKFPYNLALDKVGNLYIADIDNHRIRKVSTTGVIITVVGTGIAGYGGDGSSALSAQLNAPVGIVLDTANNLYIADYLNHRIRRVTPGGIISTIAGTGVLGYSGSNGPAISAQIGYPFGIAVSANGAIYFSDINSGRVRRVGNDGILTDVAGTNIRGFLGDGGPASQAQLNNPYGIGLDGYGNLLIADQRNARIRKVACIDPPTVSLTASSTNVCTGDVVSLTIGGYNTSNLTYQVLGNVASAYGNTVSVSTVAGLNSYTIVASTPTGCSVSASIKLQAGSLYSTKSGNWNDPSAWSCGRVPLAKDIPTISNNHSMSLTGVGVAKNVLFNGQLSYGPNGKLYLGSTDLGKLTIAARKDVASQMIPTTGGTLIVNNIDPTLNGLKIQVPNKAYTANKAFKVSYAPIIKHDIGPDFNPLTPLIHIENGGGYADSMMTLTIPINLPPNHYAIAMMYSKEKGFELLPTISSSNTEIKVKTNHLDFEQLSTKGINSHNLHGKGAQAATGSAVLAEGVNIAVSSIYLPDLFLGKNPTTAFEPGHDDWEFINLGSYPQKARIGICSGMSVTAMWYYENIKWNFNNMGAVRSQLFANSNFQERFSPGMPPFADNLWMDNLKGMRFATAAQIATDFRVRNVLKTFSIEHKLENDRAIMNELRYFFRITKRPFYLGMKKDNDDIGHAVVVYGINDQGLLIADPNKPGKKSTTVPYYPGQGLSYLTRARADKPVHEFSYFYCIPPSFLNSESSLYEMWQKSEAGTLGDEDFPPQVFAINSDPNLIIEKDIELSVAGSFSITQLTDCPDCTINLLNELGDNYPSVNGTYTLPPGNNKVGFYVKRNGEWYDFKWLTIKLPSPITTHQVSSVTATSAQVKGIIQNYSADHIIKFGVCYSTTATQPNHNDMFAGTPTVDASSSNSLTYTSSLTELIPNKKYYVRTWAVTADYELIYGNVLSFTTSNSTLYSDGITVAGGNGTGQAANKLDSPTNVFVIGAGDIYIADNRNGRIQKWIAGASSGTTVAGGNLGGMPFPEDLFVTESGAIYVTDYNNQSISKWISGTTSRTIVAGGNGQGPDANRLSNPTGVFVDGSGAIYIADNGNLRAMKWLPGATSGTMLAQTFSHGLYDVFVDASGALYIPDNRNYRIQKWLPGATSGITVAGGNGPGSAANTFDRMTCVFVDGSGAIYVADMNNHRIQKWLPGAISGITVAGGNGAGSASNQLNNPTGVFVDGAGVVYVADRDNHRIQKFIPR
ncbi:hypothetical protein IC229_14535 [Spirosoma sp. BT702]|uniref:Teneurin NHL domain-containing protein n=1 Tax=Spirosoma profusum TaxID=2771354 RepID=A0A927ANH7_9BACT|nr:papain-like cysteine protease family protein [Spirosoma profusum]MBD2701864.1 hypothetical protein [Spirosoma profusum]